jgi:hypothetical protein
LGTNAIGALLLWSGLARAAPTLTVDLPQAPVVVEREHAVHLLLFDEGRPLGQLPGPVRFGADRKFFGFLFSRERRRDGDGEVDRVGKTWKVWKTGVRFPGGGDGSG